MSRTRLAVSVLTGLVVGATMPACSGDTVAPSEPTTVTITPSVVELDALESTAQLSVEIRDQHGELMNVPWAVWSSGDSDVASVDSGGLVTAVGNGVTSVTATVGGISGSASVTVSQRVSSVAVSPLADTLTAVGDTVRLRAEAADANGHPVAGVEFGWTSGDASVATVDATGLATAVANGTARLTASVAGVAASAAVTVEQEVASVAVSPAADTLVAVGDTVRLRAEAADANGHLVAGVAFGWTSGDASVATVDATGLATAVANGTAALAASTAGVSGGASVTVAQKASSVSVSPAEAVLPVGDTVRLVAEAFDGNGHMVDGATLVWASADRRVAVVDGAGLVTAVAKGQVEVTASSSGAVGRAVLTVETARPASVTVTPDTLTLTALGQTAQLVAEVRDHVGSVLAAAVTWVSADTAVATVDSAGLATAVGPGEAMATATSGSLSADAVVIVRQVVQSVVVSPGEASMAVGDTLRLAGVAVDENGHAVERAAFAWTSSDASVATVWSGLVRGVSEGAATITAWAGNRKGSAEITVDNPDRAALAALYKATDGPNWVNSENWLTDAPLGDWHGVTTGAYGRVVGLRLSGRWDNGERSTAPHGLVGPIPPELGRLDSLRYLDLGANELTGPIPPALGRLTNLRELHLWQNDLTGSIPPELGRLASLLRLSLHDNDLTGSIPPELGRLASLSHLYLHDNDLTGLIPPELGRLTSLSSLYLRHNELSGPIPPELGNLERLELLYLNGNGLTGTVPPELGRLAKLRYMSLYSNYLTGSIPSELGNLESLESLYLSGNGLTGTIPAELGDLGNLRQLSVTSNDLTGTLPPELGNLSNLQSLTFEGNDLTGPLPQTFVNLKSLRFYGCSRPAGVCVPGTSEFVAWLGGMEFLGLDSPRGLVPLFCNAADRQVLENLHDVTGGKHWGNSAGWLRGPALEGWHGVRTDSLGRVTALRLGGNRLSGVLPGDIGTLSRLASLRVDDNALRGRLPQSLTRLDLDELHYGGTDLCVPTEDGFGTWLGGIGSHKGTGVQCLPLTDRDALTALHAATGGSGWRESRNWLSDTPLGSWHGVEVNDQGRVVGLQMSNNGLAGPIPPELGALSDLRRLYLHGNDLSGPIPPELERLPQLQQLYLGGNDLSGPIPPGLGDLANLHTLYLSWNDLRGAIPPELGGISDLRRLDLAGNDLTGPIPRELGQLSNLETLYLGWNDLNGPIPPELGNLTKLRTLRLDQNGLTGPIPPELGGLTDLHSLYLADNDLSGPIPAELGRLTMLQQLYIHRNDLSGPIPRELGNMINMRQLVLTDNGLAGRIPAELGRLTAMERLLLAGNRLSGPVPGSFGALAKLRLLDLSHNTAMAGPLPAGMTAAAGIEELLTAGTDLCAPLDEDFRQWMRGVRKLWLPSCGEAPAAYLVQTVQSRDFSVPLVEGEKALLRVFPTARKETTQGIPPMRALFYERGRQIHVENISGKAGPIPTQVDESSMRSSAAAEISGWVIRSGLEMVIEIDPDGTLDPGLGVARRIPAEGRLSVDVRRMPDLDLTLIPFVWTGGEDSSIVQLVGDMASDPGRHDMLSDVRTLLPVRNIAARAHERVLSTSNNAHDLLYQTDAIRVMEGGTGHYKGMMAPPVAGAGGVAYLPGKSSFSQPYPSILAHELGHNMSLWHAPCGAAGHFDPAFPHGEGSSGAWGYDPRDGSLVPPSTPDLMSYCGPEWVSDYHFTNALKFRLSDHRWAGTRAVASPTKSLLLWGGVDPDGQPFLNPAFVVDAPPRLPDSTGDYAATGRSADGRELFSLSFTMPKLASEEDLGSSFVFALPVRAGWEDALAAITLSGPERSVTLNAATDQPMAILRDPRSGQVRAFLRDVPDPASIQADALAGAAPGTTLDILYSRGLPDRAAWER